MSLVVSPSVLSTPSAPVLHQKREMMSEYQRIHVEYGSPATVVRIADTKILDQIVVEELAKELSQLLHDEDQKQLLLDLSDVKFLSSAALSNLVVLNKRAKKLEGKIVLAGLQPQVYEVFNITGLNRWFTIADSPAAGLQAFGSPA